MPFKVSKILTVRKRFWAYSILLSLLAMGPNITYAQQKCTAIFSAKESPNRPDNASTTPRNLNPTLSTLTNYQSNLRKLSLRKIDPDVEWHLNHLIQVSEFFDYQDHNLYYLDYFFKKESPYYDLSTIYDDNRSQNGIPFKNFVFAKDWLQITKPQITPDLLLEIHHKMMAGGVEDVPESESGKWRSVELNGLVEGSARITPEERLNVINNPYLKFFESRDPVKIKDNSLWDKFRISIFGVKKPVSVKNEELLSGRIIYPTIARASPEIINRVHKVDPSFAAEIEKLQKQGAPPTEKKESEFVRLLVLERLQEFVKARNLLGKIQIGTNEQAFIKLVAELQRDLVSIHPLYNGNGRSTRLFANFLLNLEGLPPARLVDPNKDIQESPEQWVKAFNQGIESSALLIADLNERIELGLPFQNAPEMIFPGVVTKLDIGNKKQGSDKLSSDGENTVVDHNQFTAFVRALFEIHPELNAEIKVNRVFTMSKLAELFQEFFQSKTIRYQHKKDGDSKLSLPLIDEDFIDTFGISFRSNVRKWSQKIGKWYDSKMLTWRGISYRWEEVTNENILSFFTHQNYHLISNNVGRTYHEGQNILTEIKKDFRQFNRDLITGDIVAMAMDHHRTGPLYYKSYGFSTSKFERVGKAFAMGAMVVAEYGEQKNPQVQSRLKSRINIAMYRAKKDVDLGRLKAFFPNFSYKYGRQAEVMGIGAVDPDSVMLVQNIDDKGNVISTFYRNPKKPNEVLEITGRYVPTEGDIPWNLVTKKHSI